VQVHIQGAARLDQPGIVVQADALQVQPAAGGEGALLIVDAAGRGGVSTNKGACTE
jgi:hypothetical protein